MDDTFLLIYKNENISKILEFLNRPHKNIKFTVEYEASDSIAFLDILIKRINQGFFTSIFRKKTFTGVLLNWNSLTARKYKIGLIHCLLDRIWKICTNYDLVSIEIQKIKEILIKNDYPIHIVDLEILAFINKKYASDKKKLKDDNIKFVCLVLPYINDKVVDFGKNLSRLVEDYFVNTKLRVIFESPSEIGKFFPYKDKPPLELQSGLVYRLNCQDCDSFYIGKTSRHLKTRMNEHKAGKGEGDNISSAYKHCQEFSHRIDYDNVQILDRSSDYKKILIKEMLYIEKFKPDLNKQLHSQVFSLILGRK